MNGAATDLIQVSGPADVSGTKFNILDAAPVTGTFTILTSTGLTAANIGQPNSNLFLHASIAPDTVNTNDLDLPRASPLPPNRRSEPHAQ